MERDQDFRNLCSGTELIHSVNFVQKKKKREESTGMGLLSNGNFPMRLVQMKRVMHLERWMFFTETFLSFFTKISGTFGLNCEFYPQTRKLKHRVRILDGESL